MRDEELGTRMINVGSRRRDEGVTVGRGRRENIGGMREKISGRRAKG